jgi:hypothetical protein
MTFHSVHAAQASGGRVIGLRLINGVVDLLLFCGFFGFALLWRRKREIHKRLMMLAMISLIIPAFARFPVPSNMTGWVICAFSLIGVLHDLVFLRHAYLVSIIGALLINLASPLRFILADAAMVGRDLRNG